MVLIHSFWYVYQRVTTVFLSFPTQTHLWGTAGIIDYDTDEMTHSCVGYPRVLRDGEIITLRYSRSHSIPYILYLTYPISYIIYIYIIYLYQIRTLYVIWMDKSHIPHLICHMIWYMWACIYIGKPLGVPESIRQAVDRFPILGLSWFHTLPTWSVVGGPGTWKKLGLLWFNGWFTMVCYGLLWFKRETYGKTPFWTENR